MVEVELEITQNLKYGRYWKPETICWREKANKMPGTRKPKDASILQYINNVLSYNLSKLNPMPSGGFPIRKPPLPGCIHSGGGSCWDPRKRDLHTISCVHIPPGIQSRHAMAYRYMPPSGNRLILRFWECHSENSDMSFFYIYIFNPHNITV